jgi:hypothetical protein
MHHSKPVARLFRLGDGQHWAVVDGRIGALALTRREALDLIRAELMADLEIEDLSSEPLEKHF